MASSAADQLCLAICAARGRQHSRAITVARARPSSPAEAGGQRDRASTHCLAGKKYIELREALLRSRHASRISLYQATHQQDLMEDQNDGKINMLFVVVHDVLMYLRFASIVSPVEANSK